MCFYSLSHLIINAQPQHWSHITCFQINGALACQDLSSFLFTPTSSLFSLRLGPKAHNDGVQMSFVWVMPSAICWNACRHKEKRFTFCTLELIVLNLWGLKIIRAVSVDFVDRTGLFDRFIEDWWLKRQTHTCLWETNEACSRHFIKTGFCI